MKSQVNLLTGIRKLNSSCVSWFYQAISGLRELAGTWWLLCLKESMPFTGASLVAQIVSGDPVSVPESERSPGEGNGYPLQYSCLENPMGRGVLRAIVHGVTESQTRMSSCTHTCLSLQDPRNQISPYQKFTLSWGFIVQVLWVSCFLLYKTINANIL